MATYKLIQDIEAEDHILGPLTLRQFIFALIAAFLFYLSFISVAKHVPMLLIFLLPPALFCAFFAFPWGRDQPTETWALAKLRFLFKSRRRIWNQSGMKELVTINVPKKIEPVLTDNLSQAEVKSRLQALANTIDSRGWAIKHINAVGYVPSPQDGDSDRLISIPDVPPQEMPGDLPSDEDVMDADNPIARQFQDMIDKSTNDYRKRLVDQLRQPAVATTAGGSSDQSQQWFMNHNPAPLAGSATAAAAAPTAVSAKTDKDNPEDQALSAELKRRADEPTKAYGNMRTLRPAGSKPAKGKPAAPGASEPAPAKADPRTAGPAPMTAADDPDILLLSKNNDLNVATIAREAQRTRPGGGKDEVVISLH